jgi:hypothetical protein
MSKRAHDRINVAQEERLNSLTAFMLINVWAGLFLFAALRGFSMQ